jgi:hypothetical protein
MHAGTQTCNIDKTLNNSKSMFTERTEAAQLLLLLLLPTFPLAAAAASVPHPSMQGHPQPSTTTHVHADCARGLDDMVNMLARIPLNCSKSILQKGTTSLHSNRVLQPSKAASQHVGSPGIVRWCEHKQFSACSAAV